MEIQEILPGITPLVYLLADRLKVHIPDLQRRWIPEICAVIGLVLVTGGCYFSGIDDPAEWARLMIEGTLLGYAAVGVNQSKKLREVE